MVNYHDISAAQDNEVSLQIHWLVETNAKSEKNTQVLFNKVSRYFPKPPIILRVEGDRYAGHQLLFSSEHGHGERAKNLYEVLEIAEKLANSWVLTAVAENAKAFSNHTRVAGILRWQWQEAARDENSQQSN